MNVHASLLGSAATGLHWGNPLPCLQALLVCVPHSLGGPLALDVLWQRGGRAAKACMLRAWQEAAAALQQQRRQSRLNLAMLPLLAPATSQAARVSRVEQLQPSCRQQHKMVQLSTSRTRTLQPAHLQELMQRSVEVAGLIALPEAHTCSQLVAVGQARGAAAAHVAGKPMCCSAQHAKHKHRQAQQTLALRTNERMAAAVPVHNAQYKVSARVDHWLHRRQQRLVCRHRTLGKQVACGDGSVGSAASAGLLCHGVKQALVQQTLPAEFACSCTASSPPCLSTGNKQQIERKPRAEQTANRAQATCCSPVFSSSSRTKASSSACTTRRLTVASHCTGGKGSQTCSINVTPGLPARTRWCAACSGLEAEQVRASCTRPSTALAGRAQWQSRPHLIDVPQLCTVAHSRGRRHAVDCRRGKCSGELWEGLTPRCS